MSVLDVLRSLENGHPREVEAVLSNHRLLYVVDSDNNTVLHHACLSGNTKAVQSILSSGFYVDPSNVEGHTPICDATLSDSEELVKLLIEHGANVNPFAYWGSPLHYATLKGNPGIIKLLVKAGAKLHTPDRRGRCVLHNAILNGKTDIVKLLLALGADANALSWLESPLHMAVKINNLEMIQLLLAHGANPRLVDKYGNTSLKYADPNSMIAKVLNRAIVEVPTLQCLARVALRSFLPNALPETVAQLDLPEFVTRYMTFCEFDF